MVLLAPGFLQTKPPISISEDCMNYTIRRLSFGDTIREAINIYRDNFGPLFFISLFSSIPTVLSPIINPLPENRTRYNLKFLLIFYSTYIIVNTLLNALSIEYISKRYTRKPLIIDEYIKNVIRVLIPVILLSIIEIIMVAIGFLLFIVPGIYLLLAFCLSSQVLIFEKKTITQSIYRSFYLTEGFKFEILGFFAVLLGITLGATYIIEGVSAILKTFQVTTAFQLLLSHLIQVLIAPIGACLFILVYFNQRVEKEGFTQEQLMQ